MYRIRAKSIEEMVEICSRLIKNGINFETTGNGSDWIIECSGGF